jgi:hypothetical protein
MKGKSLLLVSLICYALNSYSQSYDQLKVQLQFENYYGSKLRNTKLFDGVTGSQCLFDDWLPIEVTIGESTVKFDQGKLNLANSTAEVMYKEREMFISPEHFSLIKLTSQGRWFLPAPKYKYDEIALKGLLEVFEPTPQAPFIAEHHYVYVKEPNSNGYINGGVLEKTLMQSSSIYLFDGTKLIPIKNKKALAKFYLDKKELFSQLTKSLNTDFKSAKSINILVLALNR